MGQVFDLARKEIITFQGISHGILKKGSPQREV
jgi:hypothetical protein